VNRSSKFFVSFIKCYWLLLATIAASDRP